MANDQSEAGNYYNDFTVNFIWQKLISFVNVHPFDPIQEVSQHLHMFSSKFGTVIPEKYIQYYEQAKSIRIVTQNVNNEPIKLERCYEDLQGFSSFREYSFEPLFEYYKKDNEFIVSINLPGTIFNLSSKVIKKTIRYYFTITGLKAINFESNQYFNNRP